MLAPVKKAWPASSSDSANPTMKLHPQPQHLYGLGLGLERSKGRFAQAYGTFANHPAATAAVGKGFDQAYGNPRGSITGEAKRANPIMGERVPLSVKFKPKPEVTVNYGLALRCMSRNMSRNMSRTVPRTPACTCSPSGFKKLLNHVVFKKRVSEAAHYNRHKHHISHHLVYVNHSQKLSKTFGYLSLNKIKFCVAQSLTLAYDQPKYASPKSSLNFRAMGLVKSCVYFMGDVIESFCEPMLSRNQFRLGLRHARQTLNHNHRSKQPLGLTITDGNGAVLRRRLHLRSQLSTNGVTPTQPPGVTYVVANAVKSGSVLVSPSQLVPGQAVYVSFY